MNERKSCKFFNKYPSQYDLGREVATITQDGKDLFQLMLQDKLLRLVHSGEVLLSRQIDINYLDKHLDLMFRLVKTWQTHLRKFGGLNLVPHHNVKSTWPDESDCPSKKKFNHG